MNGNYTGILGIYTCSGCNATHTFSERYHNEKVRRFLCQHFNFILSMIRSNNRIKFQIRSSCNACFKEYNSELKIGSTNIVNNQVITEDTYISVCCGNKLEVVISLSEEYFDQNEASDVHHNINISNNNNIPRNNNNNMNVINNQFNSMQRMNNNNNMQFNMNNQNMINNNMINNNLMSNFNNQMNNDINYTEYMNKFDKANIVELNQKTKQINFLEESSNKSYKIYTSPKFRLKTVLNDLLSLYPEINYFNNNLMLNNQNFIPLNYVIGSLNINDNSFIVIKNK